MLSDLLEERQFNKKSFLTLRWKITWMQAWDIYIWAWEFLLMGFKVICCWCSWIIQLSEAFKNKCSAPLGNVQGLRISSDVDIKPWWLSDPQSFSSGTTVTRKGIYMLSHSFEPELQLLLLQTDYAAFAISTAVWVHVNSWTSWSDFNTEVIWARYYTQEICPLPFNDILNKITN